MPEPQKNIKVVAFIKSGKLHRPEDDMCKQCFKPSLWEGLTYKIDCKGAAPYGRVKGCKDCDIWFYFNNAGDLERTTGSGAPKKEDNNGS